MIWFYFFLTEYKQERTKTKPFCQRKSEFSVWNKILSWYKTCLLSIYLRTPCASFNMKEDLLFNSARKLWMRKVYGFLHFPCHFSHQHTQPPFISQDDALFPCILELSHPQGHKTESSVRNKSVRGHKQCQDCTFSAATSRLAVVLALSCCGYRKMCLSTWLWTWPLLTIAPICSCFAKLAMNQWQHTGTQWNLKWHCNTPTCSQGHMRSNTRARLPIAPQGTLYSPQPRPFLPASSGPATASDTHAHARQAMLLPWLELLVTLDQYQIKGRKKKEKALPGHHTVHSTSSPVTVCPVF